MSTTDHRQTSDQADQPKTQPAAPSELTRPAELPRLAEQLRCVDEYRDHTHRQANVHVATLGEMTSNLMEIEARFSGVVRQSLTEEELSMDGLEAYTPSIDQLIRMDKQIAQLTQLQINLKKLESLAAAKPPG
jgi:hypothetical protein